MRFHHSSDSCTKRCLSEPPGPILRFGHRLHFTPVTRVDRTNSPDVSSIVHRIPSSYKWIKLSTYQRPTSAVTCQFTQSTKLLRCPRNPEQKFPRTAKSCVDHIYVLTRGAMDVVVDPRGRTGSDSRSLTRLPGRSLVGRYPEIPSPSFQFPLLRGIGTRSLQLR